MITQPQLRQTLVLIAALGLAACSWETPVQDSPESFTAVANDVAARAASVALAQRGTPYRYGGQTPSGFDCSGLVYYAFGEVGEAVPRTTGELYRRAEPVSSTAMRPGDLVFFEIDGKMAHVGIYVGDGQFVHAPRSGRTVSLQGLDDGFYRAAFIGAGRLP
jgi:cell wall-associated NlpC family hydrolase